MIPSQPESSLIHGDCRVVLQTLAAESVDLVIADPPYFLSDGGTTCRGGARACVDKGEWDKQCQTLEEIDTFNMEWLREVRRVLQPNGTIFVLGTRHNIHSVATVIQKLGLRPICDIAWIKPNPPPNLSCRQFTESFELIVWAARSAKSKHVFNDYAMRDLADRKQMRTDWRIARASKCEMWAGRYPTQKPEALMERMVLAASRPGDLVLDPFIGSGTTGVVAVRHGRRFVGIDLNPEAIAVARTRIGREADAAVSREAR